MVFFLTLCVVACKLQCTAFIQCANCACMNSSAVFVQNANEILSTIVHLYEETHKELKHQTDT